MSGLSDKKRLFSLGIFIAALFALLSAHYFYLQVIEREKWTKEANKQHFFIVKDPFTRGSFYGNAGGKPVKLVEEIEKFHLYADPEAIPESRKGVVAAELASLLHLSKQEKTYFAAQLAKPSRSRRLALWLEAEEKGRILKWWLPYAKKNKIPRNALYFVSDYQRSYPFGKLLGQVLHTVQNTRDEKTGAAFPTGGLELSFDAVLKGKKGKRRLLRSPRNPIETGEVIAAPVNGSDVYLTIHPVLQAIAEEEIERGVKKSQAKSGWAVMMDPYDGKILALAQYPFFDPSRYQEFFNDPELVEWTKVKAITDAYEPGSIMKPLTVAIALKADAELRGRGEKPLFDPEAKVDTANGKFPGRSKPIRDTHLHHFLNLEMGIQKSSNIYMARLVEKIIQRLGPEWYRRELQETFGFGRKTGIELPSESAGVLPLPGKMYANGTMEWSVATPFSIAFGHNIQTTALQMLCAHAAIANGGYLVEPTLISKVVSPSGAETSGDKSPPRRVLDGTIALRTARLMKYTTKPGGTARRADIWGYSEAGKTGTSEKIVNGQYSKKHHVTSFVGFAPASKPAFVLLVTIDEPKYAFIAGMGKNHHGGTACAPVFREIGRRTLECLAISPDDPHGYPVGDPRCDSSKADWVSEAKTLDDLYRKWNGL